MATAGAEPPPREEVGHLPIERGLTLGWSTTSLVPMAAQWRGVSPATPPVMVPLTTRCASFLGLLSALRGNVLPSLSPSNTPGSGAELASWWGQMFVKCQQVVEFSKSPTATWTATLSINPRMLAGVRFAVTAGGAAVRPVCSARSPPPHPYLPALHPSPAPIEGSLARLHLASISNQKHHHVWAGLRPGNP